MWRAVARESRSQKKLSVNISVKREQLSPEASYRTNLGSPQLTTDSFASVLLFEICVLWELI